MKRPAQIQIKFEVEENENENPDESQRPLTIQSPLKRESMLTSKISESVGQTIMQLKGQGFIQKSHTITEKHLEKDFAEKVKKEGGLFIHGKVVQYDPKAFYCIPLEGKFRSKIVWLIEWKSLVIFILEGILKIIGKGLVIHKLSYLRDYWNILDLLVIISAIIEILPLGNTQFLRGIKSLRAIRPLKSINAIGSMKKLVKVLLKSIPKLFNVVLLLTFMILLFGILGLHLFCGNLYYRCRTTPQPLNATYWPILEGHEQLCQQDPDTCPEGSYCGHPAQYNISLKDDHVYNSHIIQYGIINFDNIGSSVLTVFQVLTIFGWSDIMYNYTEVSNQYFSAFFFSCLVLFGAFFLMNLILAVIVDAYNLIDLKEKKKEAKKLEEEASKRAKKFDAIKNMYRMMRLSQKKREIIESAGLEFRWSFFDVVFELVRVYRYEKIQDLSKSPTRMHESVNKHIEKQMGTKIMQTAFTAVNFNLTSTTQNDRGSVNVNGSQAIINLRTIQENVEDEEDEQFDFSKRQQQVDLRQIDLNASNANLLENNTYQKKKSESSNMLGDNLKVNPFESTYLCPIKRYSNKFEGSNQSMDFQPLKSNEKSSDKKFSYEQHQSSNSQNNDNQLLPELRMFNTSQKFQKRRSSQLSLMLKSQGSFQRNKSLVSEAQETQSKKSSKIDKASWASQVSAKIKSKFCFKMSEFCLKLSLNDNFTLIMNVIIILNILVMSLDRYPIQKLEQRIEDLANLFFYSCFVFELIIKLIGLKPKLYFKSGFNIFDALIILISTVDVILNNAIYNSQNSIVSVLRGLRIIRILKIAKSQENMKQFQQTITQTLIDLRNFSILLFLVIITYALLGMEFFGYKVKFNSSHEYDLINGKSPRQNFDGMGNAFVLVFNILQGENYFIQMYNVARSIGNAGVLYFVTLIVIGQIILLKLFLAVLLENFEDQRAKLEEMKKQYKKNTSVFQKLKFQFKRLFKRCSRSENYLTPTIPQLNKDQSSIQVSLRTSNIADQVADQEDSNKSLMIFRTSNKIRALCIKLIGNKIFQYIIQILIIGQSILLTLQNPKEEPSSKKMYIVYTCDLVINILFICEFIIQIIAKGLILNGQDSFLKSFWNVFDVFIVTSGIISDFLYVLDNHSVLKILQIFKSFRPLRIISNNDGLKLAVQTLIMAIPNILNVLLVALIFYLIFGIFCVSFLKGTFYYCYSSHISEEFINQAEIITKFDCINLGGEWINKILHFDNAYKAMEMLYTMSIVSWNNKMFDSVDSVDIGYQPKYNNNMWWMCYYVVFMIIFAFFLLNLFVGVVVNTFNTEKQRLGKNFLLTDTQKEWLHMRMVLLNTKPAIKKMLVTENKIRKFCFYVINHKAFEWIILGCIISNTLLLTINWYLIPPEVTYIINVFNYIFASIFLLEACLKLIGTGRAYFRDNWNIFDFLIVIATIIGIIIDLSTDNQNIGIKATIVRAFRVMRLFKIIKKAKVLRIIIDTLIITLPSLMNVGRLLLLIIFVYSIIGIQLFSLVKLGSGLNHRANFQNFGRAFLTLIKSSTGEGWDTIVEDLARDFSIVNQCDHNFNGAKFQSLGEANGCGVFVTSGYFISYSLLITIIFLNLFVAIVLENFSEMNKKENKLLSEDNMNKLRECWSEYDLEGSGFLKVSDIIPFLTKLGEPLGFTQQQAENPKLQQEFWTQVEIPTYNNFTFYYYYDVIQILTQYAYLKIESDRKLKEELMKANFNQQLSIEILKTMKQELEFNSEKFKIKDIHAFKLIQEKERRLLAKIGFKKDEMDSQHIWAGGKIKNMYGNTQLNFNGGLAKKETFKERMKGRSTLSQIEEMKLNNLEEKKQHSIKVDEIESSNQGASNVLEIPQTTPVLKGKFNSQKAWRDIGSLIDSDNSSISGDISIRAPTQSANDPVNRKKTKKSGSSILLPVIKRDLLGKNQYGNMNLQLHTEQQQDMNSLQDQNAISYKEVQNQDYSLDSSVSQVIQNDKSQNSFTTQNNLSIKKKKKKPMYRYSEKTLPLKRLDEKSILFTEDLDDDLTQNQNIQFTKITKNISVSPYLNGLQLKTHRNIEPLKMEYPKTPEKILMNFDSKSNLKKDHWLNEIDEMINTVKEDTNEQLKSKSSLSFQINTLSKESLKGKIYESLEKEEDRKLIVKQTMQEAAREKKGEVVTDEIDQISSVIHTSEPSSIIKM